MAVAFRPEAVEPKDPDETKFYYMDWEQGLNEDCTVSTSTWLIENGLTGADGTITAGALKTRITLSGGKSGGYYHCRNTVVTSDGETLQRTGVVRVMER
jgi:hypothetical protein